MKTDTYKNYYFARVVLWNYNSNQRDLNIIYEQNIT